ncbi:MAG TPA: hypothetical protein VGM73_11675 [Candidatus Didemnitutus sp.]
MKQHWLWTAGFTVIAGAGFFAPQSVPLAWFPLNDPGLDVLYLQVTGNVDRAGTVSVYCDATRGTRRWDAITWAITPTPRSYTYTFPLPDAPIVRFRVDPIGHGATLHVDQMRILNRRGEEVRRFSRASFFPNHQIAAITSDGDGWNITSTPDAIDPFTMIDHEAPLVPVGMNERNLRRCLLSTGYLAGMLWILLVAVLFVVAPPANSRELASRLAFIVWLALLAALVGNRGLIRDSVHYARFHPPAASRS